MCQFSFKPKLCGLKYESKIDVPDVIKYGGTILFCQSPITKYFVFLRFLYFLFSFSLLCWSLIYYAFNHHFLHWFFWIANWSAFFNTLYLFISFTITLRIYKYTTKLIRFNYDYPLVVDYQSNISNKRQKKKKKHRLPVSIQHKIHKQRIAVSDFDEDDDDEEEHKEQQFYSKHKQQMMDMFADKYYQHSSVVIERIEASSPLTINMCSSPSISNLALNEECIQVL